MYIWNCNLSCDFIYSPFCFGIDFVSGTTANTAIQFHSTMHSNDSVMSINIATLFFSICCCLLLCEIPQVINEKNVRGKQIHFFIMVLHFKLIIGDYHSEQTMKIHAKLRWAHVCTHIYVCVCDIPNENTNKMEKIVKKFKLIMNLLV